MPTRRKRVKDHYNKWTYEDELEEEWLIPKRLLETLGKSRFAIFSNHTPHPYAGVVFYNDAWRVWPPVFYPGDHHKPTRKRKDIDKILKGSPAYDKVEAAMFACKLLYGTNRRDEE